MKTPATVATPPVATGTTPAAATTPAKGKGKGGKGIPRVNIAVINMTAEQREAWFNEKTAALPADVKATVRARLDEAVKSGLSPRKVDWQKFLTGRSCIDLLSCITVAQKLSKDGKAAELTKKREAIEAAKLELAELEKLG